MPKVLARKEEPQDILTRRFKRLCEKIGLVKRVKEKAHFIPKSKKKQRAIAAAKKRWKKKEAREAARWSGATTASARPRRKDTRRSFQKSSTQSDAAKAEG